MTCSKTGGRELEHLVNVISHFAKEAQSQEEKGIDKYGQPLDPLDNYDWLEMASEELVDGYKYFHAERVKRNYVIKKIRTITDDKEIHQLLNYLEGKNE